MSAEVNSADEQLRSFFERWQRLEEEKAALSEDLKELFAEAKGVGFDTKAMRAVFRDMTKDTAERQEAEAIYDLYWSSLNKPRAHPAHTHEKTLNNSARDEGKSIDPKLAEMIVKGVQTDAGRAALLAAVDIMIELEEAAEVRFDAETGEIEDTSQSADLIQPLAHAPTKSAENLGDKISAPITHLHRSSPDVDKADDANSSLVLSATLSPEPTPPALTIAGETAPQVSPAAHSDDDIPAFLKRVEPARKTVADYRTHCQNPSMCAASGLRHCNRCQKAMDAANPSEAAA